jgi:hypothetical protein
VFLPGKFTSVLTIHADRSFAFTYQGDVQAIDINALMGKAMAMGVQAQQAKAKGAQPAAPPSLALTPEEKAKQDEDFRKVAAELTKEAGFRSVEYRGNGLFHIDYAISGTLDHAFVFPYNPDNNVIFPWIAIELRGKDLVRVKAPGFAKPNLGQMSGGMSGMNGMSTSMLEGMGMGPMEQMDGTFTLNTDAELVSQNNENGAETVGSMKTVTWKATPDTPDAPMASVRVRTLP